MAPQSSKLPQARRTDQKTAPASRVMPPGVRDYGPAAAAELIELRATFSGVFRKRGYQPVLTPMIEYLDVLRRGMYPETERLAFKTVEPATGETAVLRPDITPQIARMVAQHFGAEPRPLRLCYDGRILRAGSPETGDGGEREIFQAGVELIGAGGLDANLEIVELAVAALRPVLAGGFVCDIGHMGFLRAAFDEAGVALDDAPLVRRHLSRKNATDLAAVLRDQFGVRGAWLERLAALPQLYGDADTVARARKIFRGTAAVEELAALQRFVTAAGRRRLTPFLGVDLGECRGFGYYTGMTLNVFAAGAGGPIAAGGRYDNLLGRFGQDEPAVGFAVDIGRVREARSREGGNRRILRREANRTGRTARPRRAK